MKGHLKILSFVLIVSIFFSILSSTSLAAALKIIDIKDINATAYINNSYSLPKEVVATMSDKTTQKVAVTWDKKIAITTKTGTFVYKGTVKGYAKQVLLTLKVVLQPKPVPTYGNPELARAVSLGIGSYSANTPVTYAVFFKMLDAAVALADPIRLKDWKGRYPKARTSTEAITRANGMMAVYGAAEVLGTDYCSYNTDWTTLNEKIGEPWKSIVIDGILFPDSGKPTAVGPKWDYKFVAAYFYSFGRCSPVSDGLIFDYDAKSNSMRPEQPLRYEEALLAALRLRDSGVKPSERIPTAEDKAILAKVDARRVAILNSKTNVTIVGKSYYVSNSGNDANDGLSPATAWATLDKVNKAAFQKGDGVFFERDGLWRGCLDAKDYVTFSAYGTGNKPKIYGSPEDGADPAKWRLLEGTKNIWVFYKNMPDCGSVVFDDGKSWAEKIIPFWNGSEYVDYVNPTGQVMKADVTKLENLHYFCKVDLTGEALPVYMWEKYDRTGPLYLRCDAGNPGTIYKSIEFSILTRSLTIVTVGLGSVIDNLCVKYGANNGIGFGTSSVIQNCEAAWAGGITHRYDYENDKPYTSGAGDGINTSNYGNSAINNYSHHCYDNGIIVGETGFLSYYQDQLGDITVRGNLVEYCNGGMLMTIWEKYDGVHKYKNVVIDDNYVLNTGYGWSFDRHLAIHGDGIDWMATAMLFPAYTANENTKVTNNIFYRAKSSLVQVPAQAEFKPAFSGNTYVQNNTGLIIHWQSDDVGTRNYFLNLNAKKSLADVLGDKTGKILMPN